MSKEHGEVEVPEISCSNCRAACCRAGAALILDSSEYQIHRAAMGLRTVVKPARTAQKAVIKSEGIDENGDKYPKRAVMDIPPGAGFFVMTQDCGRLDSNYSCTVYEKRPRACANYEVGSVECIMARVAVGVDLDLLQLAETDSTVG